MAARSNVLTVLSALVVAFGVCFGASAAGEFPTADELLNKGLSQLAEGQFDMANSTLMQIDPPQLTEAQRKTLQDALAAIKDKKPVKLAAPAPAPKPKPAAEPKPEPKPEPKVEPTPEPKVEAKPEPKPEPKPVVEPAPQPEPEAPSADIIEQLRADRAAALVAKGDAAAKAEQYNIAQDAYAEALKTDPNNAAAKAGAEAVAGKGAAPAPATTGGVVDNYARVVELREAQAKAQYGKAMTAAAAAEEAKNYSKSIDALTYAKAVIDQNRQYLTEADYGKMRGKVLDEIAKIQTAQDKAAVTEVQRRSDEAEIERNNARHLAAKERDRKIQQLLRRASDLRKELNYEQSLEVLDQLLFLDPNNIAGQAMRDMINDAIIYRNFREVEKIRSQKLAQNSVENHAAAIPHTELITYPPDWPQLSAIRLQALQSSGGETEVDRRVREKLKQAIPVNFEGNRLENVIEYLRNVTGVNIVVNWRALEGAGIEPGTTVTLQLSSVPADKAIDLILEYVGGDLVPLGYTVDAGVVTISTQENLGKITHIRTYDIRDLVVQAPNFDQAPSFDLVEVTRAPASGGGGNQQSLFEDDDEENDLSRGEMIGQIQDLVRDTVDPDNWRSAGGLVSSMSELNGTLIINSTTENHRQILSLLGQLRETRALQINVEARFLLVDQNFLDEFLLDFDVTWNPGSNFSPISFSQESNSAAERVNTAIPGSFGGAQATGALDGQFNRGMTISGGIIGDVSVTVLLKATQANRRATSLSAPRITFFNGQRGYVLIATQLSYISDLDPAVGTDAALFDPEISVVSSGVVLDVEGTVSADRRYVTLTARPSLARVVRLRSIAVIGPPPADNGADADADAADQDADADGIPQVSQGLIEAPELELTTVRTTVSVPDKGTLLLGGQRLVAEVEIESGVPVLNKLPILNRLFTNRSTVKDERTLLILIKPTILIQNEKEEELFPGMSQGFGGGV